MERCRKVIWAGCFYCNRRIWFARFCESFAFSGDYSKNTISSPSIPIVSSTVGNKPSGKSLFTEKIEQQFGHNKNIFCFCCGEQERWSCFSQPKPRSNNFQYESEFALAAGNKTIWFSLFSFLQLRCDLFTQYWGWPWQHFGACCESVFFILNIIWIGLVLFLGEIMSIALHWA